MLTDRHPQAVRPLLQLGVGLIIQQKARHGLPTGPQVRQCGFSARPDPLRQPLDVADRHLPPIHELNQDLGLAHRQAQLEAAQTHQPGHLTPPGPPRRSLAGPFRIADFVPARFAAPALDRHFLHAQPAQQQQQHPVQHLIDAVLSELTPACRTNAGRCRLVQLRRRHIRCMPGLRPRFLIGQHHWQQRLHLVQVIAHGAGWDAGLTRSRCHIDLLERNQNRLDFFSDGTYSIGHRAASGVKSAIGVARFLPQAAHSEKSTVDTCLKLVPISKLPLTSPRKIAFTWSGNLRRSRLRQSESNSKVPSRPSPRSKPSSPRSKPSRRWSPPTAS